MTNQSEDQFPGFEVLKCKIFNGTTKSARCGWLQEGAPEETIQGDVDYLDLIIYPILLGHSTVGNGLNLTVFAAEHPRTSKNVFLMAIAGLDLIYMWAELIPYLYIHGFVTANYDFNVLIAGFTAFLQEATALAADWIIIAFSVDRFQAIRAPLSHMIMSSAKRSRIVTAGILVLAGLLSSIRLVDYYWFLANDEGPPCDAPIRPPALLRLTIFYSTTLPLIPAVTFLTILILNGLLLRILIRNRKTREESLGVKRTLSSESDPCVTLKPAPSASNPEYSASMMLAACVLLYLTTQCPAVVINTFELLDRACLRRLPPKMAFVTDPLKLAFAKVNCSTNFLLYCALNPGFRVALVKRLQRLFRVKTAGRYSRQSSSLSPTTRSRLTTSLSAERGWKTAKTVDTLEIHEQIS